MKPLNMKNYGSIPHLLCSRMGPADHACHPGQQKIATEKARDKHDHIIVLEKVDGSNVGIANVDGQICALTRAGYLASTSKYEQHHLFEDWVRRREDFWRDAIPPGCRVVGEWLAQAHGTRYTLPKGPFVAFDLFNGTERQPLEALRRLAAGHNIPLPKILHIGGPLSVSDAMARHFDGCHGCLDEPEGAVWRVERKGKVDFLVKFVRPDKIDGKYLPEISGMEPVWNWRPNV